MFADRIPGTVRNAGEARAASLVARFDRQTRDVSSPHPPEFSPNLATLDGSLSFFKLIKRISLCFSLTRRSLIECYVNEFVYNISK